MHVFDVTLVFHRAASQFVRLAETDAAFDTTARHPDRKAVAVMITARSFFVFSRRLATKFTAPDD